MQRQPTRPPEKIPRGETHYHARKSGVTDDTVRAIRGSTEKLEYLAHVHGITISSVSKIRNRKAWTHVTDLADDGATVEA